MPDWASALVSRASVVMMLANLLSRSDESVIDAQSLSGVLSSVAWIRRSRFCARWDPISAL